MRVVVLSPHRDDAAFSLALSLKRWTDAGTEVTVLNFFTRSDYAPYASEGADIPVVRASEDNRALRAVSGDIRIHSLSMLDAPLRLPIDFGSITNPGLFAPVPEEVTRLARAIAAACGGSLALSPLALGEHIDHRTVRDAALAAIRPKRLAFYEDLPYAAWTSEEAVRERIATLEEQRGMRLFPSRQRSRNMRWKNQIARKYSSQIDNRMAETIARHAERYRSAERVWAPRHDPRWCALLSAPV